MTEKENKSELNLPAAATTDDDSQSLEDTIRKIKPYIDKLWAKKKQFLIFNGVVAALAVIYLLFIAKPYYTSTVSILPEYGNQSSVMASLSGLASMAGINVGEVSPNQIYEKILKSEKVIRKVVYNKYKTAAFKDSVDLITYFKIDCDEAESNEWCKRYKFLEIYKKFTKDKLKLDIDRMTNVLSIIIEMPEPGLSADVANTMASALNNYVTTERQSFAREQSEYLSKRINDVRDSLMLHENRLKEFREKNRAIINSPQLTLEQNRLIRKVEIAQSVYLELTKQYELVKLEEVKDTPIINIMEKTELPVEKAGPKRTILLLMIMLLSVLLSVCYLMFFEKIKDLCQILFSR